MPSVLPGHPAVPACAKMPREIITVQLGQCGNQSKEGAVCVCSVCVCVCVCVCVYVVCVCCECDVYVCVGWCVCMVRDKYSLLYICVWYLSLSDKELICMQAPLAHYISAVGMEFWKQLCAEHGINPGKYELLLSVIVVSQAVLICMDWVRSINTQYHAYSVIP